MITKEAAHQQKMRLSVTTLAYEPNYEKTQLY